LGGSVHVTKKNADALVFASKETGPVVNADKTKYMVMSRDYNVGQNHKMKIDNKSVEKMEHLKSVGRTQKIKIPFRKKLTAD
jgi:hypothetical protein